ncbi:MAG: cyclophilin-like fold protein [Chloroflexota bacterium]|nr:cyclophilin-like fold protein [Chloroflexota bacterium]
MRKPNLVHQKGVAMFKIAIASLGQTFTAELNDSPTARKLWAALPVEGEANLCGEEIYFGISVSATQGPGARQEVAPGTIACWPVGEAFCIFFGPTLVSRGDQPHAYSPVNVLGQITRALDGLREVQQGEKRSASRKRADSL